MLIIILERIKSIKRGLKFVPWDNFSDDLIQVHSNIFQFIMLIDWDVESVKNKNFIRSSTSIVK